MAVHPLAAAGFGSAADAYDRGRPGYASAAIRWLARRAGLGPGVTVVDLAAGTGKLSHSLAATGAEVIAVEPLDAMRRTIGSGIRAVAGTAEAIPVESASVDAVTVGQAFHWFDGDAALAEIHRVLRPGGSLALLWNVQRMEDPIHASIEELIERYCVGIPRHRAREWRSAFERTSLFEPLEEVEFPHSQRLDAEGVAARVGSISAIAALPDPERGQVLDRARSFAEGGEVTLRYMCRVEVADRRGAG
jgi:ubiquinone/menaquinone biosynthesis C-methylase UbiE